MVDNIDDAGAMTLKMDATMAIVWANEVQGTPSQYAFKADSGQTSLFMTINDASDCYVVKRDVSDGSATIVQRLSSVTGCNYLELSDDDNYVYVGSEGNDILLMLNSTDLSLDKVKLVSNLDYLSYMKAYSVNGQNYLLDASYVANSQQSVEYTTIDMSVTSTSIIWNASLSCINT